MLEANGHTSNASVADCQLRRTSGTSKRQKTRHQLEHVCRPRSTVKAAAANEGDLPSIPPALENPVTPATDALPAGLAAVPICLWWYVFLGVMPTQYREYAEEVNMRLGNGQTGR
ncbi:hypothetical protein WJX73_002521 [Symbiochloris irregularis]|uniref:Uncharacterized protein n=1 Tax=Symbiochloris irregularis TaxID=706552 RepID=A0AAW1NYU4_9CHLO